MEQFAAREIGARIAHARKERGLSQEELAALSSFSKRSLQDYEAGVTIPYKNMAEISRLLGRPVDWFLHGEPVRETPEIPPALREQVEALLDRFERVLVRLEGLARDTPVE